MKKITQLFFLFTLIGILFLIFRIYYTKNAQFIFLVWNLFLAWIPFLISLRVYKIFKEKKRKKSMTIVGILLGVLWLLFFPNAPYLLTDYIHLNIHEFMVLKGQGEYFTKYLFNDDILIWFDFIVLSIFIWTGVILGFISLYIMEKAVEMKDGTNYKGGFVASVLFLTSIGIFIGRFIRFNSWDLITNPFGVLVAFMDYCSTTTIIFVLSFWVLMMVMYLSLTNLKLLFKEK